MGPLQTPTHITLWSTETVLRPESLWVLCRFLLVSFHPSWTKKWSIWIINVGFFLFLPVFLSTPVPNKWQLMAAGDSKPFSLGLRPLLGCPSSRRWSYIHVHIDSTNCGFYGLFKICKKRTRSWDEDMLGESKGTWKGMSGEKTRSKDTV